MHVKELILLPYNLVMADLLLHEMGKSCGILNCGLDPDLELSGKCLKLLCLINISFRRSISTLILVWVLIISSSVIN